MANVSSVQNLSTKVTRQEVLSASAWHSFLIVMLWVGGLATLGWFVWFGYYWGSSECYTCTQNKPVAVQTVAAPASAPPASSTQAETATLSELAKDLSAIAKIVAEQKAVMQSSASKSASAITVVVPSLPKAEKRAPVTKQQTQTEPVCPCPPPAKTQALEQGPAPMPTLSFAEHRRNEMWSALRR